MSFSFLDDAYPGWKNEQKCANEGNLSDVFSLYEDFDGADTSLKMPQPRKNLEPGSASVYDGKPDADLRIETFKDYNLPLETASRGPGPKPYDSDDDYFKILSSDWERDVARYQATARDPFLPKDYSEEGQIDGKGRDHSDCVNVAHHLDDCKTCRHRLEDIFRKVFEKPAPKNRADDGSDSLGEWIMLIVIGMLIILALDRLF